MISIAKLLTSAFHRLLNLAIPIHTASFEDPHHFDADPDPDPAFDFAADPDPIFYFDAVPDPDPDSSFKIKAQNL